MDFARTPCEAALLALLAISVMGYWIIEKQDVKLNISFKNGFIYSTAVFQKPPWTKQMSDVTEKNILLYYIH